MKIILKIFFSFVFLIAIGREAQAAAFFYLESPELEIGSVNDFTLNLKISTPESLNALSSVLQLSSNLEVTDISDGNSIINLWLDKPQYDIQKNQVTFSGLVPNGFSGEDLLILSLRLKPVGKGEAAVQFLPGQSQALYNDPKGTADQVFTEDFRRNIIEGKTNSTKSFIDLDPPESFTPSFERSHGIFEGQWFIAFSAEDKGSGIANYQLAETRHLGALTPDIFWKEVSSPTVLADQDLKSFIYVKAIDKAGNERIATLPPPNGLIWYEEPELQVIIIFVLLSLIGLFIFRPWQKSATKSV